MERGMYAKVAFMLTGEQARPNLHREIVQHHMENELRKRINEISERQSNIQQNRLLRNGVYAISSLLGDRGRKQEEVYNGFKDELTDYSKELLRNNLTVSGFCPIFGVWEMTKD